ncbi:MAG: UDP-N-acetylmuramate dehydrogenase [Patescibacteria group bacterium]
MIVRESVPLQSLTTFRIGGPARYVIDITSDTDLSNAVAFAQEHALPYRVLGEGSNVLAADEGYAGVLFRMCTSTLSFVEDVDTVTVTSDAGMHWDTLVKEAAARGLWGIENLAGIPGSVGAAPVQNIGAYGVELERCLTAVTVFNAQTLQKETISKEASGFGYRESRFKHEPHLIITNVTFTLSRVPTPELSYGDIRRAIEEGAVHQTPADIGEIVRRIRSKKFPDITYEGTAGSFFKNPILSEEVFNQLTVRYPNLPHYPITGGIKIPLAYILDQVLGLRGYRNGKARLFEVQPLVLVADRDATRADVDALADDVTKKVFDATEILIEREVRDIK